MKPSLTRVGLLGCGSIGSTLAQAIQKDASIRGSLVCIFDKDPGRAERLNAKLEAPVEFIRSFEEFVQAPFDLLVECASQEAVRDCAEMALEAGKDLLIMSLGALMEEPLWERLNRLAAARSRVIHLPSGAIGGLDLVRAAGMGKLQEVSLTTTKNPSALAGAPFFLLRGIDPRGIRGRVELYEGSAREAVKLFPANVNVAAALSLAGIGGEKTRVKIVADSGVRENIHEIRVKGDFGEASITVTNVPHPENPRTSTLAALSALEALRRACLRNSGAPPVP